MELTVISNLTQQEILQYAISNGMLDLAYMQEEIQMHKRKELIEKHPYKIWENKKGVWFTYIPDKEKGRIRKERTSKNAIENVIVEYWKQFEENPTLADIFNEYYEKKLENKEISKATYDRYVLDFNKYFVGISSKRIKEISELDIDNFIHETIGKFNLTAKRYSGVRTIILAIFKYAKKKQLIGFSITNIINDIDISKKAFKSVKKAPSSQVFTESELPLVTDYLMDNIDMMNLGLLLIFKTGLRNGELAKISREEVMDYTIPIKRTETRYKDKAGKCVYDIKESPKTEAGFRSAILPTKYKWIIDKILELNPDGEWLFEKNGNRIKTYSFRRRLNYICEAKVHMEQSKSPHKIRKTYCTLLLDSKVEESLITNVVGHTDIKTTKEHYNFDRKSVERKREVLGMVNGL